MAYDLAAELEKARSLTLDLESYLTLFRRQLAIPKASRSAGNINHLRDCFTNIPMCDMQYKYIIKRADEKAALAREALVKGSTDPELEVLRKGVEAYDANIVEVKKDWETAFAEMTAINADLAKGVLQD